MKLMPPRSDILLAVVVVVVTTLVNGLLGMHGHGPDAAGYALTALAGIALAWWRLRPTTVLLAVFACHLAFGFVVAGPGVIYLPLIIAFGVCVVRGDRRVAYGVLVAGYAVAVGVPYLAGHR